MFSVIIPVYNGAEYLEKAIGCVLRQTYTDWELIIIDDGSTDKTWETLKKYEQFENINIIRQENRGVSAARNAGMRIAKGGFFAFLDCDDIWEENHLEVMNSLIEKYPSAGLYATFTRTELVNGGVISECTFFKDKEEDILLEDFFEVYHQDISVKMFTVITTCITREAYLKIGGFPEGCAIGEDLELSLRAAAYYPVALSKIPTGTYKKENSTATKDKSFDPDWGFFDSVNEIYDDESIPASKRENLKKVMDWFSMRRYRHYMIDGERKKAMAVYRKTDKSSLSLKDRIINLALMLMPAYVIRRIFLLRWRGMA